MNAFCAVSDVSSSQPRLKAQPVNQVISPRLFVGNYTPNAVMKIFAGLVRACNHDVIYLDDHNQFYLAVLDHTKNTWTSPTLLHTVLYHCIYQWSGPLPPALL